MQTLPTPFPVPGAPLVRRGVDRRSAHRARLAASVTVTCGDRIVDAIASDLSRGGIRLVAGHRPRLGETVALVFFVNGDIVCARATVRWCAQTKRGLFAFGVRFTAMEEDAPVVIASYCDSSIS